MITRDDALAAVKSNVRNKNLLKHMLAVEAIMRGLAQRLDENPDRWALAGLVHDIDYDMTADKPEEHSIKGAAMLSELGVDSDIVYAVKAHNEVHGLSRNRKMDKALYAADPLSGLIVAAALIHPDKKLASIDTEFILNRFSEKSFARGANREQISSCAELGLELAEFIQIGLESMQTISADLGL